MILPDTQHVSLRNAMLWIAYGDAKPRNDYAGNALWFTKEKEIKDDFLAQTKARCGRASVNIGVPTRRK